MSRLIACEGKSCNAGHSAADRERAIMAGMPHTTGELRDEAYKYARATVSHELRLTAHEEVGAGQMYACVVCGHPRVYGAPSWTPWQPWTAR